MKSSTGVWVKASESLKRLPLEELLHIRNPIAGVKCLGNFFKKERRIACSIVGTEMYESYVIDDLSNIEWLDENPAQEDELWEQVTRMILEDYAQFKHGISKPTLLENLKQHYIITKK